MRRGDVLDGCDEAGVANSTAPRCTKHGLASQPWDLPPISCSQVGSRGVSAARGFSRATPSAASLKTGKRRENRQVVSGKRLPASSGARRGAVPDDPVW